MEKWNNSVADIMGSIVSSNLIILPCPDIVIGKVEDARCQLWASVDERRGNISSLTIKSSVNEKTIVVVLESPHIEEFVESACKKKSREFYEENGIASSPAMSVTGDNLQKYLKDILREIIQPQFRYRIILMNSIQYQCSLGYKPQKWRDHVWLKLWFDEKMNGNFVQRLKKYNPDIVINCCTKYNHRSEPDLPEGTKTVMNDNYLHHCIKTTSVKGNSLKEFVQHQINANFDAVEKI